GDESGEAGPEDAAPAGPGPIAPAPPVARGARSRRALAPWLLVAALGAIALGALAAWKLRPRALEDPLAGARFRKLTDFAGIEQAAALSRDGQFVAFLSDRDGPMDVWVTQLGSGRFVNLTRGGAPELVNPSVRSLGFSPDGTLVTYGARGAGDRAAIDVWAAPLLGGAARPFLQGAAELDWSADGTRLVFHTPGPGDPMFVRDGAAAEPRRIFAAAEGLHAHFLVWSPDDAYVYFVQGTLPDGLDLWRIRPDGGAAERLTHHDARVSHPVFVDERTLLYLATDEDGHGPWIHALDVETRDSRKVSPGIDEYTSLSASRDGRRLVATLARPRRTLWRVPVEDGRAAFAAARRIPLTTGDGASPRLGPD
ncbi:MAG TPA: DNA-binding protein, partial [Anaeromyxobacteraceae bacterium]|nr:DNA-binding protein [Anaeromyxobacteraceae bacterium]